VSHSSRSRIPARGRIEDDARDHVLARERLELQHDAGRDAARRHCDGLDDRPAHARAARRRSARLRAGKPSARKEPSAAERTLDAEIAGRDRASRAASRA
jgi:hypothetical protein